MDPTKTGALIRALRKERNMTQKDLAERLHITDRAVSKWERGLCAPDISLLEPLAEALGISILELIQGERGSRPEEPDREEVHTRQVLDYSKSQLARKLRSTRKRYLCLLAACLVAAGLLLCRRGSPSAAAPPPAPVRTGLAQRFLSAVTDAAAAMGRVCAFVVFFLVLLRLAETATGPWSAPAAGFMELTNGILRLTPDRRGFVTAAALLGWGGLSVHCQTAAVTAGSGIPMGRYLPAKAVQAALSAGLAWLAAPHLLP